MTLIQYSIEMTWVFVLGFLRSDLNPVSPYCKSVVFQRYQIESWGVCQGPFLAGPEFFFSQHREATKSSAYLFCFTIGTLLGFGLLPPSRLGFSKYPQGKARHDVQIHFSEVAFSLES